MKNNVWGISNMDTNEFERIKERRGLHALIPLVIASTVVACGDSTTSVNGPHNVALNFQVSTAGAPQMAGGPALASGPDLILGGASLTVEGTNGTLVIEEIRLIIAEVELDGEDDSCDDDAPAVNDCAEFEALPSFLDLPLDGEPIEAFVGMIPAGTYEELEFEIEDLEDDEDDPVFASAIAELRAQIIDEIPDWPLKASGMVSGTFESVATGLVSFRVFLDAEIEIERDLIPPLVVGADGVVNADLTVDIRPDIWFTRLDGSVMELQDYDWDLTGQLLEFELEMEDGITEIEHGS
jgi:hypothetical protein